ncbi:MAG TPA: ferritin-like domain-containing protein [Rhizomicrobium sp.]|jgi:bacterioferritin (cytochrome b1)
MIEDMKSRRSLLIGSATTLSVAGLGVVLGSAALPTAARAATGNAAQDIQLLNAALGLEHEGIAAYQLGAESKLLKPEVLKVAVTFQSHHKQHRDDLIAAINKLGGKPVVAKSEADYAKELNASSLKSQADVLHLALKLEKGATNAYLGVIPSLGNPDLYLFAARVASDESFHAAFLGSALGEPIPEKAPMFG